MATIDVTDPAREVLNQAPPLQPINLFDVRPRAARGARARGRRLGRRPRARGRRGRRQRRGASSTAAAPSATSRVLRTHDRYGNRIDEVELDPSWHWLLRGAVERDDPQPAVARAAAGRARRPRGAVHAVGQRQRRRHVPGVDDLRGDPGAARRRARAGRRVGAAADPARLRARRAGGDGDDRAPGRLRRARQHHPRRAGRRRRLRDPRPQVVLLLSAVRRVPGARPGARRALVLPGRARAGDGVPAAQGQARHALAAVVRGRVPRHRRPADRRGGPRRAGDHPDGQPHAARLPARARPRACAAATLEAIHHARHRSAFGALLVDQPAMRNVLADLAIESEAATASRDARGAQLRRADDAGVPPVRHRGDEVLGLQARRRRTPPRRSSAWAATASSRTPGCRCCTATRR